jgi:uncharacterized repeat protein (TIGR01451 family)
MVNSDDPVTPVWPLPVSLTVLPKADLGITKTDAPDPVLVGGQLTYTLLVTNDGPHDATGVTVVDNLPADVTFVSASAGCLEATGKVTCTVGRLAFNDLVEITIVVTADVEGLITNTATVSGNEYDPSSSNNTASQETTVTLPQADLAIAKTDSPDPVLVGEQLTYTLLVTNNGPQAATGVEVVDTLPGGVTFVSASAGCSVAAGTVTCDVGDLAVGGEVEITIVVTADVEGGITNSATVTGAEQDPVPGNNTATQETNVIPATLNIYIYLPIILK